MPTAAAIFNDEIIAQSDDTVLVEGNHYFPVDAVRNEFLRESGTKSTCPWKGRASYYHIEANGEVAHDGAWYYSTPSTAAAMVKDRIAFGSEITIKD